MKVIKVTKEYFQTEDEKVYFFEPLENEISVEDMQKIVDANEKLVAAKQKGDSMQEQDKLVLNQTEAARLLGLSRHRFLELERAGRFRRVPNTAGRFYLHTELEAFATAGHADEQKTANTKDLKDAKD